jgi:hypothetical protein
LDGCTVDKAIDIVQATVLPNIQQAIGVLCGRGSTESRLKLTAEEIAAPLDILFEFGELETVFPPDPNMRPLVLLGPYSNGIGAVSPASSNSAWKRVTASAACLHAVLEVFEPSTGMRYSVFWLRALL